MFGDALALALRPLTRLLPALGGFGLGTQRRLTLRSRGLLGAAGAWRVGCGRHRCCRHKALAMLAFFLNRCLSTLLHPLGLRGGPTAALLGRELMLAGHEGCEGLTTALPQRFRAGRHDEALLAFRLLAGEALFNGGTLCLHLGTRGRLGQDGGAAGQQQSKNVSLHVSEVSTSRRARARYSAERISCSRETVRGNSCASGPSV